MMPFINIELTSRCNKSCLVCGRRKIDRDFPEIASNYGDMDFALLEEIAKQIPSGTVVQFHWNGEPTLYPNLGEALSLFKHCIRQFDTNGKLLLQKAKEIIDNLDILTVSVVEGDSRFERYVQEDCVSGFIGMKKGKKPRMVYRCLGNVDTSPWDFLEGQVVTRVLHNPMGSFGYQKPVTKPEFGFCQEIISHLAIDRFGDVSPCVRFDPYGKAIIGNVNVSSLAEIWHGEKRKELIRLHVNGERDKVPLCNECDYYGVPRGD
jgi:radical SAM protein with 4Fe4S-binding SPASM domain